MTDPNPAFTAADALGLRLIMSMLNRDVDTTNNTLADITRSVADDPYNLSLVCCGLATHTVSALKAISDQVGDPDFGLRMVQSSLQRALDANVDD